MDRYSTKKLSNKALEDIKEALEGLDYGSIEIYVTNSTITQITKRVIKKTVNVNGIKPGLDKNFKIVTQ